MSLVAQYKLNSDATDASGNSNNGVATDVSWVSGKVGNGGSFNGSTSKIVVSGAGLDITAAVSACWWQYATDSNDDYVFAKRNDTLKQFGVYAGVARTWFFYSWNGSPGYIAANTAYTLNTWQHWAVTANGTAVNWYLNGEAAGSGTLSGAITTAACDVYIGCRGNGAGISSPYTGYLDDLRIYDSVLSLGQIKAIYNGGTGTERQLTDESIGAPLRSGILV